MGTHSYTSCIAEGQIQLATVLRWALATLTDGHCLLPSICSAGPHAEASTTQRASSHFPRETWPAHPALGQMSPRVAGQGQQHAWHPLAHVPQAPLLSLSSPSFSQRVPAGLSSLFHMAQSSLLFRVVQVPPPILTSHQQKQSPLPYWTYTTGFSNQDPWGPAIPPQVADHGLAQRTSSERPVTEGFHC